MNHDFQLLYIRESLSYFKRLKLIGDKSLVQIQEEEFHYIPDENSNSVAMLIEHLHFNIMSRWGDFEDKQCVAQRKRFEFWPSTMSHYALGEMWEHMWHTLLVAIESLKPDQLSEVIDIEFDTEVTCFQTIERQKSHFAVHIGQFVYLCKHHAGPAWLSLSIPTKL